MTRILYYTVSASDSGKKLEDFLREQGCSHHVITHLKRTEQGICLNGVWAYTTQRLNTGDQIRLTLTEQEPSEHILPVPFPLDIVYEDDDLMIVNKPSDMPIHPSVNNYDNTLANAVMYYFKQQNSTFVYRCINRLDRDTSGLLIIAKHMLSGAILSSMSANHQIHREYLTIVEGILPEAGTIDAPIARQQASVLMRCVDLEQGERAVTHYQRLACFPADLRKNSGDETYGRQLSLARVQLETGRTHQIRVHMKHIGHPMIGDFLYYPESQDLIPRQALHSHTLSFQHPITREQLTFSAKLPADMQRLIPMGVF